MSMPGHPIVRETVIPSDLGAARQLQCEIETALQAGQFGESDIFAIKMALEEALVNAIKHGNQMDPSKAVRIAYTISPPEHFHARITDEGPGFNPEEVPDPTDEENRERPCGRGLFLIRYYMSEVSFQDSGNTIVLFKLCPRKK